MAKGTINIDINPCEPEQVERLRQIFIDLIRSGCLYVRNGSVTMHFDNEGELQLIDAHMIKFKKRKI